MKKLIKNFKGINIFIIFLIIILSVLTAGLFSEIKTAYAQNTASIGFVAPDKNNSSNDIKYYAECNGKTETVRVSISEKQTTDTVFSLTESIVIPDISTAPGYTEDKQNEPDYPDFVAEWEAYWQNIFLEQGKIFTYSSTYTLPANQNFVDVVLTQNSNAESITGTRLRQIAISTSAVGVEAGYDPFNTGIRSILDVVVYDTNGENSIIVARDYSVSSELDGFRTFKIIRTGDNALIETAPSFQYELINYDINNEKELKFETALSAYTFKIADGKYEREAILKLKFFDNDRLNLKSVYNLKLFSFENCGIKIFDNDLFAYGDISEGKCVSFFIADDELELRDDDAMLVLNLPQTNPYIRSEEGYDAVLPEDGGILEYDIYARPGTGKSVKPFRLFYTIDFTKTAAIYGTDFILPENYSFSSNSGYIDFALGSVNCDVISKLKIQTVDNKILDGAKSLHIKFFLSDEESKILLPAKDFLNLAVWDNEHLPSNNTVSWAKTMAKTGAELNENVVTFNSSMENYFINLTSDYSGNLDIAIPIRFEDITALSNLDYENVFDDCLLKERSYLEGGETVRNYWGTELKFLNDKFYGKKRLKVTIIEDLLPDGIRVEGVASIFVDFEGSCDKDYFYSVMSAVELSRDEDITVTLNRFDTHENTNYIRLSDTNLIEGVHFSSGLFPYTVNWAENQTQKTIAIPLLSFTSEESDFHGKLLFLNGDSEALNSKFIGEFTSINLTLLNSYKNGEFYFATDLYSFSTDIGALEIEVKRTLGNGKATIDYSLNPLLTLPENQRAEISIDINDICGTLVFEDGETTKSIVVTVPSLTRNINGRQIGVILSNPSRCSTLTRNAALFSETVIALNDTTSPNFYFNQGGLSKMLYSENKYLFYPVTQNKSSVSFKVGVSGSLPVNIFNAELAIYSEKNFSVQGFDVFIKDKQITATELITPYVFDEFTFNYKYSFEAELSEENDSFYITFAYSRIYDILPIFDGNMLCLSLSSPFIFVPLPRTLISAEKGFSGAPEISMKLDTDTIKNNDTIAITVLRSEHNRYLRQTYRVAAAGGEQNMYEPLNQTIVFAPYEESKTVLFNSLNGVFTLESQQPVIKLFDNANNLILERNVYIISDTSLENRIIIDALYLGESLIEIGAENKTVQMKFTLTRSWNEEISIVLSSLHNALTSSALIFPIGTTELYQTFTIDGLKLTENFTKIGIMRANFPDTVNGKSLSVRFNNESWTIKSTLGELGMPSISLNTIQVYESSGAYLELNYQTVKNDLRIAYCELSGTAVLGTDYSIENYDISRGGFLIGAGLNKFATRINTVKDKALNGNKTIILTFYELDGSGERNYERAYTVTILENDSYGTLNFLKDGDDVIISNLENTGIVFEADIELSAILGDFGIDYTITGDYRLENNILYVGFDGESQTKTLRINYLTQKRCVFDLILTDYPQPSVINAIISVTKVHIAENNTVEEIFDTDINIAHVAIQETKNYFGYNSIFEKYLTGNASFIAKKVDIYGNGILWDIIYNYKTVEGKIIATVKATDGTVTSNEFIIPSKVNADTWADLNGDGKLEMIYLSCYPYSFFGGEAEFDAFNKYGAFYIDFAFNKQGTVLELSKTEVNNKFLDINLLDLNMDGYPEASLFIANSPFSLGRFNYSLGDNSLYILENSGKVEINYSIIYYEAGKKTFDCVNMRLASVIYHTFDYQVPYITLNYINPNDYNIKSNKLAAEAVGVTRLVYGQNKYKNIAINSIATEITEGEYLTLNVFNISGSAGAFALTYEGISAVAGRDFAINGTHTYTFAQGEKNKEIRILTLDNYLPSDGLTFKITINSTDFFLGSRTSNIVTIKDKTVINKDVLFTINDEFNVPLTTDVPDLYESNYGYITGDKALFTAKSLVLNGLGAFNNYRYFPRLTLEFNGKSFTDSENLGYVRLLGLALLSGGHDGEIAAKVDFLAKEGEAVTNRILASYTFSVLYRYAPNYTAQTVIETEDNISVGQKAQVCVYVSFEGNQNNALPIEVTYKNTVDGTEHTYCGGANGIVTFYIEGGSHSSAYNNNIKIKNLITGEIKNYSHILNVYGDTILTTIRSTNGINGLTLGSVKIKITGIDVNYSYEGTTDASSGNLKIYIIPFKKYEIRYNVDNDISHFKEGLYIIDRATHQSATAINVTLDLREENTEIKNVRVCIQSKEQLYGFIQRYLYDQRNGGTSAVRSAADYVNFFYSYLSGTWTKPLSNWQKVFIQNYFERYGYNNGDGGTKYIIKKDVFLGDPDLKIYKSLHKNPDDIVVFAYGYYPVYSTASVKFVTDGIELSSQNSVMYNFHNVDYNGISYQQYFVARTGLEDSLIQMEILSEAYTTGKKNINFVSFGSGLGRLLTSGINETLASVQTPEIPDTIKFLDGMSFAFSFAGKEMGYEVNEEEMTISIYLGLTKGIFERSHGASYENMERPTLEELKKAKHGGCLSSGSGQAGFALGLGGKMKFQYDYDREMWVLFGGELYVAVEASYTYTKYFIIPIVSFPAFFSATVSVAVENTIIFDWDATECAVEISGETAFSLGLEIEVGLGIKGFFSASVFAKGEIEVIIQYHTGGSKLTLSVSGGVRVQIIFWKYEFIFGKAEWSTQSDGYLEGALNLYNVQLKALAPNDSYNGVAQLMNAGGEIFLEMGLKNSGVAPDIVIVQNVFGDAAPELAELSDGTKMLMWINQDASRAANDREIINYIYFDGENWSEIGVMDQTVTADLFFDLKPFNDTFAVSFSEVKEALGATSSLSERLLKSEIAFSVFDKTSLSWTKTSLTDNNINDRIVLFEMMNDSTGIMVLYQSQNTNINDEMTLNEFFAGENAHNRLLYSIYANGSWGEFKILQNSVPAIVNLSLKIVNNIAYIALETDNDMDFDTVIDREILLVQYIFANGVITVRALTENNSADTDPILQAFNNKLMIVFKSGDDVVCYYENKFTRITELPKGQPNFSFYSDDEYAVLLWSQSIAGKSQIFASIMTAEANVFSAPYQITEGDNNKCNGIATVIDGNLFVYYCEDEYFAEGIEGNFTVKRNIKLAAVPLFSDLSIEVPEIDTSRFLPGSEQIIPVLIYNQGNIAVLNPQIKVNIGGIETTFTVDGAVPGMCYITYCLNLTMPDTKTNFTFEVKKEGLQESDLTNNTASADIMKTDIAVIGCTVSKTASGLLLEITVENKSGVDARNLCLALAKYSDTANIYDSINISFIEAGATGKYFLNILNNQIAYNSQGVFWSKIFILTEGKTIYSVFEDDYNADNNIKSLSVKRAQLRGQDTLAVLNGEIQLFIDRTVIINYIYTGTGTLSISSSDNSVASVENGIIKGLKAGAATITLSDGTSTKTVAVTVSQNKFTIALNGQSTVTLSQGEIYSEQGATCLLNGQNSNGKLRISHFLDTDIIGTYTVTYEYIESGAVVAAIKRTVLVLPIKPYAVYSDGTIRGYALRGSTVVLYDNSKKEISRMTATEGMFCFNRPSEDGYYNVIILAQGVESEATLITVGIIKHILTFYNYDGTVIRTEALAEGETVTPPIPLREGYTFGGWDKEVAAVMSDKDITYTAQWILNAPIIAAQRGYSGICDKKPHNIFVDASHPLGSVTYQWYKGSITDENLLADQRGSTLFVDSIDDSGVYYCRITYTDGEQTAYTDSAAIEVNISKNVISNGAVSGIALGILILILTAGNILLYILKKKILKNPLRLF